MLELQLGADLRLLLSCLLLHRNFLLPGSMVIFNHCFFFSLIRILSCLILHSLFGIFDSSF